MRTVVFDKLAVVVAGPKCCESVPGRIVVVLADKLLKVFRALFAVVCRRVSADALQALGAEHSQKGIIGKK